jgi:predicted GIY-YIG superfamily endonuclease
MYYVYVLRNKKTKTLYYGHTHDLKKRFRDHNKNGSWELVFYEAYKAEMDARRRERRLKQYAQALAALKIRLKDSLRA